MEQHWKPINVCKEIHELIFNILPNKSNAISLIEDITTKFIYALVRKGNADEEAAQQ